MGEKYLIVGLGNPGRDYEETRHNIGFRVVKSLASQHNLKFLSTSFKDWVAQKKIFDKEAYLLLPSTFVNNSGAAVKRFVDVEPISLEHLLVVSDDLNLDFGQLRIRKGGSDGGHNGLHSIMEHLKTKEFSRLRFGIGRPRRKEEVVEYVLGGFRNVENKRLPSLIQEAVDCCLFWLAHGINNTMNYYNRRKEDE